MKEGEKGGGDRGRCAEGEEGDLLLFLSSLFVTASSETSLKTNQKTKTETKHLIKIK